MGNRTPICVLHNILTSLVIIFVLTTGRVNSSDYVRLVGGKHLYEGRVEVFYSQQWGTVCDDGWSIKEAQVVCSELGYPGADQVLVAAAYGPGTGPIWLDNVQCTGQEASLSDCYYGRIGTHNCGHQDDVSVVCTSRGTLRLVSFNSSNEGELYIMRDTAATISYPVCADSWTDAAGQVACRQLGFSDYSSSFLLTDLSSDGRYLIGFGCRGNERRLEDCPDARWVENATCWSNAIVYLRCDTTVVRLVNGGVPSEGHVEVFYGGTWGAVCDDYWGTNEADVVCRQVGYHLGATDATRNSHFGVSSGAILLDNVDCTGEETSIFDCQHAGISQDNCDHYTTAGVVCLPEEKQLRLLGGQSSYEGVVEIWLEHEWGFLCDVDWGLEEADVACRQLGRSTGSLIGTVDVNKHELFLYTRVWLLGTIFHRRYACEGYEASLNECAWTDDVSCQRQDVVQIACRPIQELDVRMVNGRASDQGRLEIHRHGEWGTLNSIGMDEALVVCRQLGYESVIDVYVGLAFFGEGSGAVWGGDTWTCDGNEESLLDCIDNDYGGGNDSDNDHTRDVGLLCKSFDSIGIVEVRLVNNEGIVSRDSGRLEVLHDGVWGSICAEEQWTVNEVQVICGQLGHYWPYYTASIAQLLHPSEFDQGWGKIWLSNVSCDEDAPSLGHCNHSAWGRGECSHQHDVGLDCLREEPTDTGSPGIPGWEIAIICVMACLVIAILLTMAVLQRYRRKRLRGRCASSTENNSELIHSRGHHNFEYTSATPELNIECTSAPPEYRPPTPPPSEPPPSYERVMAPLGPANEVMTMTCNSDVNAERNMATSRVLRNPEAANTYVTSRDQRKTNDDGNDTMSGDVWDDNVVVPRGHNMATDEHFVSHDQMPTCEQREANGGNLHDSFVSCDQREAMQEDAILALIERDMEQENDNWLVSIGITNTTDDIRYYDVSTV